MYWKMRNLFILFTLSVTINLFGQARIDGQRRFTEIASSPVVTNFVGWAYDSSKEKWAGYYNTIWSSYKGNNKKPIRTTAANMSRHDNIVSLQVKKIKYQDSIFFAIIYTSWTGYYDYPTLMEGWHSFKQHCLLVYEEEEYKKILNVSDGGYPKIKIIETYGQIYDYPISQKTVNGLLNLYFDGMKLEKQRAGKIYLKFKLEDNNTIRIAGPTPFSNWQEHFTKEYYEINMKTFNTLFIK